MTTHAHTPDFELVDAYITGGLSTDEREQFESHLRDCSACSDAVARLRNTDDRLLRMFAEVRPSAGFEDRVVRAVRAQPDRSLRIPSPVRRAAVAAAAVLFVGTVGYYGGNAVSTGGGLNIAAIKKSVAFSPTGFLFSRTRRAPSSPGKPALAADADGDGIADKLPTASTPGMVGFDFGGGSDARLNWANYKAGEADVPSQQATQSRRSLSTSTGLLYGDGHAKVSRDQWGVPQKLERSDDVGSAGRLSGESDRKTPTLAYDFFRPGDGPASSDSPAQSGVNTFAGKTKVVALGRLDAEKVGREKDQTALADTATNVNGNGVAKPAEVAPPIQSALDTRKIIRNGTMEFEVDSFDNALAQIVKIVGESGGFVGNTDSQKLPNGKVKGTVTLRVPPDRLDVLVLSLRALGDLKSQQITAQDITKEYTDIQSQLTAARAMENRLLELIKSGSGAIKDLLAAEKELGTWREKIEKAEGEIRYYNSLVSLSTLSITVYERDIKTPAAAVQTETADVGIEADDVDKGRADAIKMVDEVHGRVFQSEFKRFDAGQYAVKLLADIPPDATGSVIDRLKQLGRVSRLEVNRQQTAIDGTDQATATTLRIERKPTRLIVSIYNVANVAPRRTTSITVAASDVEAVYASLLTMTKNAGGRVATSNLERSDPARATGSMTLEFPPDKSDAALSAVRAVGDVLKLSAVDNPDTQNTTDAKRGITLQLVSLASIAPRETVQQSIAAANVAASYHAILDSANAAHARVQVAQLNEQDPHNVVGTIDVEVRREDLPTIEKALAAAGDTAARNVTRAQEAENTVDSKVLLRLSLMPADQLAPRERAVMEVEVTDTTKALADVQTAVIGMNGRVLDAGSSADRTGRQTSRIAIEVPAGKLGEALGQIRAEGKVRSVESTQNPRAIEGSLVRSRIEVTFATADGIVAENSGLFATIRNGLATSVAGLLWSVQLLVIGLCLIGPWVLLAWIVRKLWKRSRERAIAST